MKLYPEQLKKSFLLISLIFTTGLITGQELEETAAEYFKAVKLTTKEHFDLWNLNIYGPMILVDPATREIYASEQDGGGVLEPHGKVYTGILPKEIHITGAPVEFSGKIWAMLPYPFPIGTTITDAKGYLCHELFHRVQKQLGFAFPNEELNEHIGTKDGRIYLKLELQALISAISTEAPMEVEKHLRNAMIFRKIRHEIFEHAEDRENIFELNEGITQYTTTILRGENRNETKAYLKKNILMFLERPTYIRTFAYHTIPAYGYLLRERKKYWNQEITMKSNLTEYFINEFDLDLPNDLKSALDQIMNTYSGDKIIAEEETREKNRVAEIKSSIDKFINKPHTELPVMGKIVMSLDPSNIVTLKDLGTVYKGKVRLSQDWGILEVEGSGLFVKKGRTGFAVTLPTSTDNEKIYGNGWDLWLNEEYELIKVDSTGNYTIRKVD